MNDLCLEPLCGEIISYADDTCLVVTGDTPAEAIFNLNSDLFIVSKWMAANSFSLNSKKTFFMHCCLKQPQINFSNSITLHSFGNYSECLESKCSCDKLLQVQSVKYLGVILDNNLNY